VDTGSPSGSPSPLTCGAVRGEATSEEAPFRAPVAAFDATSDADDSRLEECLQKKQKLKVSRGVTQTSDAEALEEEGGGGCHALRGLLRSVCGEIRGVWHRHPRVSHTILRCQLVTAPPPFPTFGSRALAVPRHSYTLAPYVPLNGCMRA